MTKERAGTMADPLNLNQAPPPGKALTCRRPAAPIRIASLLVASTPLRVYDAADLLAVSSYHDIKPPSKLLRRFLFCPSSSTASAQPRSADMLSLVAVHVATKRLARKRRADPSRYARLHRRNCSASKTPDRPVGWAVIRTPKRKNRRRPSNRQAKGLVRIKASLAVWPHGGTCPQRYRNQEEVTYRGEPCSRKVVPLVLEVKQELTLSTRGPAVRNPCSLRSVTCSDRSGKETR